jgi:guanine nucleotide-binding protein subunit alpha
MSFFTCFNDDEDLQSKRQHRKAEQELKKARKDYNATNRLLLLGAGESGKSTIVKQMVLLHVQGGFTKA